MTDRITQTQHGWDIIVDGKRHGTWRSAAEARAGMKVEQDRARKAKEIASAIVAGFDAYHERG